MNRTIADRPAPHPLPTWLHARRALHVRKLLEFIGTRGRRALGEPGGFPTHLEVESAGIDRVDGNRPERIVVQALSRDFVGSPGTVVHFALLDRDLARCEQGRPGHQAWQAVAGRSGFHGDLPIPWSNEPGEAIR